MRLQKSTRVASVLPFLALLLLAVTACGNIQQAVEQADVASPGASTVSGTVTYLDRSALPPNAVVEVELVDASRADAPATVLSTQLINADGNQVPFPFELPYDPAQINPAFLYLVQARITADGQLLYTTQRAVPVITNGAPTSGVEVIVDPVATSSSGGLLTGTVTYLERIALDSTAIIEVELQDVSSGTPSVVTTAQVPAAGQQVPIPFEMPYDPAAINPTGTYLLYGRIIENEVITFASPTGSPVLTNGAPTSNIELIVSPVAANSAGGVIQGIVNTPRSPESIAPGSVLQVELREPMLADAPAASVVEIPVDGLNFPISFELPYDPATIAADRAYVLAARILNGSQLLYATPSPVPALTNGAPASNVTVPVAAVPDPAGGVLRFTATSDSPMTWPVDSPAYLNIEIREPMLADAPATAFAYLPLAGLSFPVAWELGYDAGMIDPNKDYVLDARIIDNNVLTYSAAAPVPVLTKGAPGNDVTIPMTLQGTGGTGGNANVITGNITTDAPAGLDPAAVYFVDLREAGSTGDPLVTISSALNGQQFDIPFEIPFDPAIIDPARDYVIGARILLGDQVLYASQVGVPVLTKGAPTTGVTVNIPAQ